MYEPKAPKYPYTKEETERLNFNDRYNALVEKFAVAMSATSENMQAGNGCEPVLIERAERLSAALIEAEKKMSEK